MRTLQFATLVGAAALVAMTSVAAHAAGDAAKGEKVFRKCKVCHVIEKGKKATIGPNLHGVVGRKAGSWDDYNYSDAMKKKGEEGLVWTPENLHEYLKNPRAFVPHNKMTFAGLRKKTDRDNVIAYLEEQSK